MLSAGGEPLVLRIALDSRIPMSLIEAHHAPLALLLQSEALLDAYTRIDRARTQYEQMMADHARARR